MMGGCTVRAHGQRTKLRRNCAGWLMGGRAVRALGERAERRWNGCGFFRRPEDGIHVWWHIEAERSLPNALQETNQGLEGPTRL